MALPQQGTETFVVRVFFFKYNFRSVNGLTPTGDGNVSGITNPLSVVIAPILSVWAVLMALPQQGTETVLERNCKRVKKVCVNGLTPTGDGNMGGHIN